MGFIDSFKSRFKNNDEAELERAFREGSWPQDDEDFELLDNTGHFGVVYSEDSDEELSGSAYQDSAPQAGPAYGQPNGAWQDPSQQQGDRPRLYLVPDGQPQSQDQGYDDDESAQMAVPDDYAQPAFAQAAPVQQFQRPQFQPQYQQGGFQPRGAAQPEGAYDGQGMMASGEGQADSVYDMPAGQFQPPVPTAMPPFMGGAAFQGTSSFRMGSDSMIGEVSLEELDAELEKRRARRADERRKAQEQRKAEEIERDRAYAQAHPELLARQQEPEPEPAPAPAAVLTAPVPTVAWQVGAQAPADQASDQAPVDSVVRGGSGPVQANYWGESVVRSQGEDRDPANPYKQLPRVPKPIGPIGQGVPTSSKTVRVVTYDEVSAVAKCVVSEKRPVVIVMRGSDADLSRRILDFSFGLCCGTGAIIKEIGERVYVVVPKGTALSVGDIAALRHQGILKG